MYTSCSHSLLPAGYKSPARENSCRNSLKLNMRNWFPEWSWAMSEFDSDSGNETETPARQLARRPKNRPTGHKPTDPSKKSSSAPPSTADLPAKSEVVKAGKATKARLRAPPPTPASTAVPTPVPSLGQLATTPKDSQVACTLFPPKTFRSFSTSQSQRPV
jgi:hypothetical protein